jgi:hypothetical protein
MVLLFSVQSFSSGQERFLHFTEVDGLPRNITTTLAQDQYGSFGLEPITALPWVNVPNV